MKMPSLKHLINGVLLLSAIVSMAACSKDDRNGKSRIQIALTDDPGDFKAVYVDVREITVSYDDSGDSSWHTLPDVKTGLYNLLTLVNDKDTVLADAEISTGTIKEIRLVLGDNNWVVTNAGDSIKLQTPGGQSSGIKLKINISVFESRVYKFLLDFDVAKSIHRAGNSGQYILEPVIRTVIEGQGGDIKGVVKPAVLPSAVLVLNGTDTVASTYSDANGGYLLKQIRPGSYTLHYISVDPTLQPAIKQGVVVELDKVTIVDSLTLVP
jgi:hypothetical protein